MVIPGTDQKTNIPFRDDFRECDTHQEVKALAGTGDRSVNKLTEELSSYLIHPHLMSVSFTTRRTEASQAAEAILQVKSTDPDERTRKEQNKILMDKHYTVFWFTCGGLERDTPRTHP
jgi:hypothetical protein